MLLLEEFSLIFCLAMRCSTRRTSFECCLWRAESIRFKANNSKRRPKSKLNLSSIINNNILFYFLVFFSYVYLSGVQAACPTIFYAQSISRRNANAVESFFSRFFLIFFIFCTTTKTRGNLLLFRSGVKTAAECANFCGLSQFCRTAIFNHNTHGCDLTYNKLIECG